MEAGLTGNGECTLTGGSGGPTFAERIHRLPGVGYWLRMRDITAWTRSDLEALVSANEEEGLHLDYKSSAALEKSVLKDDLSKDVAAFANADGGVVVFGIEEKDRRPFRLDAGVPASVMTAERLEDIVHGNVSPRPVGVRVKGIPLADDRYAFVVSVPAATALAPHQAADRRYYRRYETKNQPMYDHEIRDLMRRSTTSAPRVDISIDRVAPGHRGVLTVLRFQLVNESPQPIQYARIRVFLDQRFETSIFNFSKVENLVEAIGAQRFELATYAMQWSPPAMPVTPELPAYLGREEFDMPLGDELALGYEVRCPGSTVRRFATFRHGSTAIPTFVWHDFA